MSRTSLGQFRDRLQFGNLIFTLYILAFTRQYTWPIRNQTLAWSLAILLAAAIWYGYVMLAPPPGEKLPRVFWLIAGLPLLFIYLLRGPIPLLTFSIITSFRQSDLYAARFMRRKIFFKTRRSIRRPIFSREFVVICSGTGWEPWSII